MNFRPNRKHCILSTPRKMHEKYTTSKGTLRRNQGSRALGRGERGPLCPSGGGSRWGAISSQDMRRRCFPHTPGLKSAGQFLKSTGHSVRCHMHVRSVTWGAFQRGQNFVPNQCATSGGSQTSLSLLSSSVQPALQAPTPGSCCARRPQFTSHGARGSGAPGAAAGRADLGAMRRVGGAAGRQERPWFSASNARGAEGQQGERLCFSRRPLLSPVTG
jgi:hypothetical protein